MASKFVDFNDPGIPLGKRKVAYVRYAMMHGTPLETAKLQAARKFKVRETTLVAPPMHYYIVLWEGALRLRNCSEHIYTDEEVVMLIHKYQWYKMEQLAERDGIKGTPLSLSKSAFLKWYDKHIEEIENVETY